MTQKYSYSINEFVTSYEGSLTRNQYKDIIYMYCEELFLNLLRGYETRLPAGLGYISFYKMQGKSIDWSKTNKFYSSHNQLEDNKKRIYERNEHTDGFVVFPKWLNKNHVIKRKSFFKFHLSRVYKRRLAKLLKEDPTLIGNINMI